MIREYLWMFQGIFGDGARISASQWGHSAGRGRGRGSHWPWVWSLSPGHFYCDNKTVLHLRDATRDHVTLIVTMYALHLLKEGKRKGCEIVWENLSPNWQYKIADKTSLIELLTIWLGLEVEDLSTSILVLWHNFLAFYPGPRSARNSNT